MKILVTGGLGTIGVPLVKELRDRGHEFVLVIDQRHHHADDYYRCDVSSYRQLRYIFDTYGPFEYVYHLAAEFGRWNGEDYYEQLWTTNAIGTKHMIRLQEMFRFRMIFSSSSEVYGDWDSEMTERTMDMFEIRQLNDYAISKWVNEMQIMNSAAQRYTETVRVRLFNTYGPGEYYTPYRSVACKFIYHALNGMSYPVHTGHHRSSTYIDDTVRTLANIVDNFKPGEVYNVGGSDYHTIERLSELVLKHTGADPALAIKCSPEPHTTKNKWVDCSKAVRDLRHRSTVPLDEGIRRTVEWMRSVYL